MLDPRGQLLRQTYTWWDPFGGTRTSDHPPLPYVVFVSVLFLGIQAAAMYALGHAYGRSSSPNTRAIVTRAGLWSLLLSWTFIIAVGHGVVAFPLPAWLVLGSQIGGLLGWGEMPTRDTWFSPYGVPWAWLSIACSVCAYVISAVRARSRAESQRNA